MRNSDHIRRITRLSDAILRPSAAIGKPGPSSWGLPVTKVGDGRGDLPGNVDFAFICTCLFLGFRSSAWTDEPFMPALDQTAARNERIG